MLNEENPMTPTGNGRRVVRGLEKNQLHPSTATPSRILHESKRSPEPHAQRSTLEAVLLEIVDNDSLFVQCCESTRRFTQALKSGKFRNASHRLGMPKAADIKKARALATRRGKHLKLNISYGHELINWEMSVICASGVRLSMHFLRTKS